MKISLSSVAKIASSGCCHVPRISRIFESNLRLFWRFFLVMKKYILDLIYVSVKLPSAYFFPLTKKRDEMINGTLMDCNLIF